MKAALVTVTLTIAVFTAVTSCCSAVRDSTPEQKNNSIPVARVDPSPVATSQTDLRTRSRVLQFSGYDWIVKSSHDQVGPGPNYFSDSDNNVTVDGQGRLHLRITQRGGRWHCAEVISQRSFGYGTYRFYLDTNADDMDPRVVLGMFTWNDAPAYNHREIDVEISRWGRANNENGQFVVQPYTRPDNIVRFRIPTGLQTSTHSFVWKPDNIFCQSLKGHRVRPAEPSLIIRQQTFTNGIPQAGGENARINLWLMSGRPPVNGKEVEIFVSKFEFEPQS